MSEGRGKGFLTIYDTMEANDFSAPIFETDGQAYTLVNSASDCSTSFLKGKTYLKNKGRLAAIPK